MHMEERPELVRLALGAEARVTGKGAVATFNRRGWAGPCREWSEGVGATPFASVAL
jgi:hypothetical protein